MSTLFLAQLHCFGERYCISSPRLTVFVIWKHVLGCDQRYFNSIYSETVLCVQWVLLFGLMSNVITPMKEESIVDGDCYHTGSFIWKIFALEVVLRPHRKYSPNNLYTAISLAVLVSVLMTQPAVCYILAVEAQADSQESFVPQDSIIPKSFSTGDLWQSHTT